MTTTIHERPSERPRPVGGAPIRATGGGQRRNCGVRPFPLLGALALDPSSHTAAEFEAFYRDRAGDARRYAATILGHRAAFDLEDALQDAWARAWRAWDQADPTRRDAWFLRIVRNCCLDMHRRHRATEPLDETREPSVDLTEPIAARLDARRTVEVLMHLKPPLREALWLREAMELSYAEIAEVQNVPIGTVMSRLHTARKRLARLLGGS